MYKALLFLLLFSCYGVFATRTDSVRYDNSVLVHPVNLFTPLLYETGYWIEIDYIRRFPYGLELLTTVTVREDKTPSFLDSWLYDYDYYRYRQRTVGLGIRKTFTSWRKVKPYVAGQFTGGYCSLHEHQAGFQKAVAREELYLGGGIGGGFQFFFDRFNAHIETGLAYSNSVDLEYLINPNIAVGFSF